MLVNLLIWSSGDRAVKAPRMDQEGWTQRWAVGGSPPPLAGQRRPRPDPTRPVAPCLWSPGVPRKLRPRRPGVRECRAAGGPAGVARWRSSRGWKPGSRAPRFSCRGAWSAACPWGAGVILGKREGGGQHRLCSPAGQDGACGDGACGRRTCGSAGAPTATCPGAAGAEVMGCGFLRFLCFLEFRTSLAAPPVLPVTRPFQACGSTCAKRFPRGHLERPLPLLTEG